MSDTIFALSSGPAPAGVAVIRLSGPQAGDAVLALTGTPAPLARQATLRTFRCPRTGEVLDQGLVLSFPAPASFTGEDVIELQGHGGAASIAALLTALGWIDGCRLAEAGEFTRRAFANGRMDLTEVEGLSDLIAAETEAQRRLALHQASGEGRDRYQAWTDRLMRLLALLEATVDFPEDDLPDGLIEEVREEADTLVAEWNREVDVGAASSAIRDGVRIAIVGAPNVGKSSLLNGLAGREAAIVSETAGTTRDVVEVRLDLSGYLVTLSDTAGLRDTEDSIEAEGVKRAQAAVRSADLTLLVSDRVGDFSDPDLWPLDLAATRSVEVLSKIDLAPERDEGTPNQGIPRFAISAKTGEGISNLLSGLGRMVEEEYGRALTAVSVRARHREALDRAADALDRSRHQSELALVGEEVRLALNEIGRITGRVDVEQILDIVFGEFCIGK